MQQNAPSPAMNIDQLQDFAINVVENVCSIFAMPVELLLRPRAGSRYYSPPVIFFASAWMLLLPLLLSTKDAVVGMIPFSHSTPPPGLFSIASLSKLFFLMGFVRGFFVYGRMIHPEREEHSRYEGPPLPFIYLIPGSGSIARTRIMIEPLFVAITATILTNFLILQPGLCGYLHFAALCLAMKGFVRWYRSWEFSRDVLDAQFTGPIIARLVEDKATEEELARVNLAAFPKNIPPNIRQEAAAYIAREFSVRMPEERPHGND